MIHFAGIETFAASPAELYPKFADCGFLAGCLPDAHVTVATPDRAAWRMKPKLSFVTGELETNLTVTDRTDGESVRFGVFAKGVGATSIVETSLTLKPTDAGGSEVHWTGDITAVTGLLKMVPKPLIQATAQKVMQKLAPSLKTHTIKADTATLNLPDVR